MNQAPNPQRRIHVPILTRVEGEGSLVIRLSGQQVVDVQLSIYEPPRLFESLLRGRSYEDVADITARICGICPIAYQMTAVQALESAFEVIPSEELQRLRRLMYCGEWIESHALHMHLLHAPDFFDEPSGIDLARRFPEEVKRGLRLKKIGNRLLEVLGGRAIHPVNLAVGGYYRWPDRQQIAALVAEFEWGLAAAVEAAHWVASFPFPEFHCPAAFVALSHPDEYAITAGQIRSTRGLVIDVASYEICFTEHQVSHSTALQSQLAGSGDDYFVGPLARVNLNRALLSPAAQRVADAIGWQTPCYNPYRSIIARALEVVHAFEEGLEHLKNYRARGLSRMPLEVREATGMSATEAPRGLIYHRYGVAADGKITKAKIVPPTSQNQSQIEADLRQLLPGVLQRDDAAIAVACEKHVRNYDPCISCSTHFLQLKIERSG